MPTPPTSTPWVPLYPLGGASIPAVTNGKWLKGAGGAMVWDSPVNFQSPNVTAANTDLALPDAADVYQLVRILAGGGTLRSMTAVAADGTKVDLQNYLSSTPITLLHQAGGGLQPLWIDGGASIILAPGDTASFVQAGGSWLFVGMQSFKTVAIGTTLPASPTDGQEAILVDSLTAPSYAWRFKYVNGISDANKWVYIGGSPQRARVDASGTWTSNASYIDPSNICSVTLLRGGLYDILFGGSFANNTANQLVNMAPKVGAGVPTDSESAYVYPTTTGISTTASKTLVNKVAGAGEVVKIQFKPTGNGNVNHQFLAVTPVRVS